MSTGVSWFGEQTIARNSNYQVDCCGCIFAENSGYLLQDGVRETGVTVAFTVRAMDAGPVLAQERVAVDEDIQAPELLADLFKRGSDLLLSRLPDVWSGVAAQQATPQVSASCTALCSCCACMCRVAGSSAATPEELHGAQVLQRLSCAWLPSAESLSK